METGRIEYEKSFRVKSNLILGKKTNKLGKEAN